jgi:Tfp pilus assembly protein PilO
MTGKIPEAFRWWRIDLAGLGVCALVTLAVYLVLVRPYQDKQVEYQELSAALAERSLSVGRARSSLSETRKGLERTEVELSELPLTLEPAAGVNQKLARLADVASRSGLEVYQLQPDSIRSGSRYSLIPITLSGLGDYRRVTSFLSSLHDGFADVGVVGFDLSTDNPSVAGKARFDLDLVWYTTPTLSLVEE